MSNESYSLGKNTALFLDLNARHAHRISNTIKVYPKVYPLGIL